MSCLPGMPCYNAYRIAYPFSCGGGYNNSLCLTSDKIIYNGPNLACTGIQSQDNLEIALQKIDDRMCSDAFISHIIVAIEENPVLKAYFCQLVSTCSFEPTTTTTSSSTSSTTTSSTTSSTSTTSTTTTTTTAAPTTTTTTTLAPIPPGTYTVGEAALGGKIAYILQPGDPGYDAGSEHGFVATVADLGSAEWGCYGTYIPGAIGTAIGTGNQNTLAILAVCSTSGIAAKLCNDLVEGGYSDWYLPSIDELNKLYLNRIAIGGFLVNIYWSSTENSPLGAQSTDFATGVSNPYFKDDAIYVRAIRSF